MDASMTPVCPACGCSLVRLGVSRERAARLEHRGEDLLFCCQGCVEAFRQDPDTYLAQIEGWIVCPSCLAEKPAEMTVSIEYEGDEIRFCRCPHCVEAVPQATGGAAQAAQ